MTAVLVQADVLLAKVLITAMSTYWHWAVMSVITFSFAMTRQIQNPTRLAGRILTSRAKIEIDPFDLKVDV